MNDDNKKEPTFGSLTTPLTQHALVLIKETTSGESTTTKTAEISEYCLKHHSDVVEALIVELGENADTKDNILDAALVRREEEAESYGRRIKDLQDTINALEKQLVLKQHVADLYYQILPIL
jgi:hypothetical protein